MLTLTSGGEGGFPCFLGIEDGASVEELVVLLPIEFSLLFLEECWFCNSRLIFVFLTTLINLCPPLETAVALEGSEGDSLLRGEPSFCVVSRNGF